MSSCRVIVGDCLEAMREMAESSVEAIVTDPPYGLSKEPDIAEVITKWLAGEDYAHRGGGFMGKSWDSFVPGPGVWREALNVLKPGGYALVFCGTRTVDLMGISLRLGGFEIRDCIVWNYATGFPKSLDISKAIDREAGAKREVVGTKLGRPGYSLAPDKGRGVPCVAHGNSEAECAVTAPATEEARRYEGWGTALKPAVELVVFCRKPLSEKTVAKNVLKHGTGGLNIDATRIGTSKDVPASVSKQKPNAHVYGKYGIESGKENGHNPNLGRWPANALFDEESARLLDEQSGVTKSSSRPRHNNEFKSVAKGKDPPHTTHGHDDSGGASRFFFVAKASKRDRNEGLEGMPLKVGGMRSETSGQHITRRDGGDPAPVANHHPCVKPTTLLQHLVRLVTPPGGMVLDPFCGSGSTGKACVREGFSFVGVEMEEEYADIARARIAYEEKKRAEEDGDREGRLFDAG